MEQSKRKIAIELTFDWDEYDNVADEIFIEDSGISEVKDGVTYKIISDYAALCAKVEQCEKDQGMFAEWLYKNRWFQFENDKWYYTFEMGTSMSEKTYEKNYVKTTSELFASYQKESGVSLKREPVPQGPATTVLVPCSEDDPRAVGGYTSYDGRSLCHVRESEVPVIEGAVWVKASQFKFEVGIAYHAKDSKSKGAGHFDDFGNFFWIDHNMTPGDSQDDLLILDESEKEVANG